METEKKRAERIGAFLKKVGTTIHACYVIFAGIVLVIGTIYAVDLYLNSKIETKISNPDFLKKLSRTMRPSLIFDEKESIQADMGAASFVEKISVSKVKKDDFKIVISPREHLGVQPVLEALDGRYVIRAERGKKFDWVFHLSAIHAILAEDSAEVDKQRFRLEIIR